MDRPNTRPVNGDRRHVPAGSFILFEDTHGKGHKTEHSPEEPTVIWISLDDEWFGHWPFSDRVEGRLFRRSLRMSRHPGFGAGALVGEAGFFEGIAERCRLIASASQPG